MLNCQSQKEMMRINALLFLFFISIPVIYAQSGSMDAM
jgi:hypothetical protein